MRKVALLTLFLLALTTASAQSASPPSFAKAGAAARAALPGYVLFSCTRSGAVINCDMMRDARGWRHVRTVAVGSSGKARVGAARKLCRLAPARKNRCGFGLPRR